MQFLIRSDDDLALIEGRRRLARQRDSVIANDIDTHGWGLLIDPTAGAAGDPHSRSLCRAKPVYSGQSYGNYWARAEHSMAQPRLRGRRTKGDLIVAVGGHLFKVAVPGLARIAAELLGRPAGQQVPSAFDVLGGKRFAGPGSGQVWNDRSHAVLRHLLIEHHEIVEDVHHRSIVAPPVETILQEFLPAVQSFEPAHKCCSISALTRAGDSASGRWPQPASITSVASGTALASSSAFAAAGVTRSSSPWISNNGIVSPAPSVSSPVTKRAACMNPAGLVARKVCCTRAIVSGEAAEPTRAVTRSPKPNPLDRQSAIQRDAVHRKSGPDHHVDRLVATIERPRNFTRPHRPLYNAHHVSGEIDGLSL